MDVLNGRLPPAGQLKLECAVFLLGNLRRSRSEFVGENAQAVLVVRALQNSVRGGTRD